MSDIANPEVQGAVSPEEKPIIENIISLFQKLLSMNEAQAPDMVTEAMGEEMEEVDVAKAVTDEDGETPAEGRLDNVTPTTDESLRDLGKSINTLNKLLAGKPISQIKKAQAPTVNKSQNDAMTTIATMISSLVHKMDAQEKFNSEIMQAIGFTDDIVSKSLDDKPVAKSKPIQSLDSDAFAQSLANAFKSVPALNDNPETRHPFNQKTDVRKSLRGIADFVNKKTKDGIFRQGE